MDIRFPTLAEVIHWFNQVWNLQLYSSGDTQVRLNQVLIALMVVIIGIVLSKRVAALFGRRIRKLTSLEVNTIYFLQKLLTYFMIVIIVLVALPIAGIPITIFTVMGGALAIGLGFGAQNLFNNLMSGFIIMVEKPIRLGDIIELDDEQGRIEDIGNRCVRVRRSDGVDVLIPNSKFLEEPVVNWTLFDNDMRGKVSVGVAYGSSTEKVRQLLEQTAIDHPKVHKTPEPFVLFEEFGDNALAFTLLFWAHVERPMDLRRIQSDLRYRIDALFREHDITISFPQRDVHLDTLSPLEVKLSRE